MIVMTVLQCGIWVGRPVFDPTGDVTTPTQTPSSMWWTARTGTEWEFLSRSVQ